MTERTLVGKTLGMAVFRRNIKERWVGPLEGLVRVDTKDWNAMDDFYRSKGTALIRETFHGITVVRPPEGWDHIPIAMENRYSDGTTEGSFTDEDMQENAKALNLPKAPP